MLNKRDVRILLLAPKADSVAALAMVLPDNLRKLAYLLGGTGGCGSHNTRDGPAWYGGGRSIRLDWVMQASDKQLDFKAPWCHVRWMKNSCTPQALPAGAVLDVDCGTANGHVEALHALADRDIQRLIIPHGALPARLTVLLPLLGWYQGELAAFRFNTIRDQMRAVLNLAELQKTHVIRHWQLVGIPLAQHNLHQQDALNIANCHLCDGQFRYLYVIKVEEGHEEKELFATALNKYQLEADRVIGGVGAKRAVDLLRDSLTNSGVCVYMACAVHVLGARLRRREAGAATPVSGESQGDSTVPTGTVTIAHAHDALVLLNSARAQHAHNGNDAGE